MTKDEWMRTGLGLLGEVGAGDLTVERLTEAAGVTKGSFYHHFQNVEEFQERLIAFWADQYLSTNPGPAVREDGAGSGHGSDASMDVADGAGPETPPGPLAAVGFLDTIMREVFAAVTEPEVAIRVWAHADDRVRSYVERVDAAREGFVLDVMRSVAPDEERARLMADTLSTMLVGSMTVLPRMSPDRVLELYEEFKRVYGLSADAPNAPHDPVRRGAEVDGKAG